MPTSSTFSTDNQYIKYRIVVTESNVSIENNTSSVNAKVDAWRTNTGYTTTGNGTCYCTINGTKYSQSISTSQKITHNSHTVLFNRTVTITHGQDGKKTIGVSAYIKHDRFSSSSHGFNVALADIPRQANILTAPNFTDVDNPVMTYSNPAGEVVESLRACITTDPENLDSPIVAYRDLDKLGTEYTFNLTDAERTALLQATPNSNTLSVYYVIETVIADVTYYSVLEAVLTVANANPTITGASYEDINPATIAITSNPLQIIQNIGQARFNFTTLTALKYATLARIDVTIGGQAVGLDLTGTTQSNISVNYGVINSSANVNATVTLTDSRGNSTALTMPVTMLAWALPNAVITCGRVSNFYSETELTVDGSCSELGGNNQLTLSFRYKEEGASTWSAYIPLVDAQTYTVTLDNTKAWNIQVLVEDKIGSVTYNLNLDKGIPLVIFDRLKKSLGVEKIPTVDNGIDALGDIQTEGDLKGANVTVTDDVTAGGDVTATGNITGADGSFSGDVDIGGGLGITGAVSSDGIELNRNYSLTERPVGRWVDGSLIYEKVIQLQTALSLATNTWTNIEEWTEPAQIIYCVGYGTTSGTAWSCVNAELDLSANRLRVQNTRSSAITVNGFIIRYFYLPQT